MTFDEFWDTHYFNKDKSGYLYKHLKFTWEHRQEEIDFMKKLAAGRQHTISMLRDTINKLDKNT